MVLAVLEAHCGVKLGGHDVYLNVAGGLRIQEPAADLAAAAALVSSLANAPLAGRCGLFRRSVAVRRHPAGGASARPGSRKPQSSALPAPSCRKPRAREAGEPGLKVTDVASLASLVADIAARGNAAARPPKAVDKTGDGTATPRYTRGASKPPLAAAQAAGSAAETGLKLST